MPIFKVDIEKRLDGEFWTNRYFLQAGDLSTANAEANNLLMAEEAFHRVGVQFLKMRVSDIVPNTDNFIVTPLGSNGQVAKNGSYLPLFNAARVDLSTSGVGRPSRKYYRLPLCAGDVVADYQFASALAGVITTELNTAISNLSLSGTPLVDVDGQVLNSVVAYVNIGMRQLRRGTKQRTNPIL